MIGKDFDIAVDLAKEWREFSLKTYGWECREFLADNLKVWVYFADDGRHSAVHVTEETSARQVNVAFHSPPKIEFNVGLDIEQLMRHSRQLLDREKELAAGRSAEQVEREKLEKIKVLKHQLEVLEGAS